MIRLGGGTDIARSKEKGVRLGYMGHLTLISEEVLKLAERIPLDLLGPAVVQKLTSPAWTEYVDTTLTATRTRDNAILGGVRPQSAALVGINSSVLGTTSSEVGDDSTVLAAIVNRGLQYENGTEAHAGDDFEEDAEDRDAQEEPVRSNRPYVLILSLCDTCRKALQMTFQTSSVALMRMMTTKRWWVGLATVISRLALESRRNLKTMMKMKGTNLEEGASFTNDGMAIIMKMMNLVSAALDLEY